MVKKKSKPSNKKVSAEELGPTRFKNQKDYEEQVALEEAKPEEKLESE